MLLPAVLLLSLAADPEPAPETARPRETVVTATRTPQRSDEVTVPTEVITRREIEVSGARDLAELLEVYPGVEIARDVPVRTSGVRLLGLDPEYVLVLIDGERVPGRFGGTLDIERLSLRDVERIEIVKGPSSVVYGSDAMGGVINLITHRPQRPLEAGARASYGGRSELDLRGGAGAMLPWMNATLGAGFRRGDAFDLDPSTVATTGSALDTWDVGAAVSGHPGPVDLGARLHYERRDTSGIDLAPSGAVFDRRNRDEAFTANARAEFKPDDPTTVTARAAFGLFRDQFQQDQRLARDLDLYQDAREQLVEAGLQLDRRILGAGTHLASVGTDGLIETLRSPRLSTGYGLRYRGALYVQDDWRVLDQPRVAVAGGVRADLDSQFGPNLSPRIAVRCDPRPGLALRASLGGGFRAPSFQELLLRFENPGVGYVVEGNPALQPEHSRGLNVSADWEVNDGVLLSAGAYRMDLQELITIITLQEATPDTPTRFGYENTSRAFSQGLELSSRVRLFPSIWLDAAYTLADARDLDTGLPLEGRAVHRATARLTMRYRRFNLDGSVGAALVGPRAFRDPTNLADPTALRWTSPYVNADARIAWRPWPFAGVFVYATNLFNAGNPIDLPLAPRGFHAGLEGTL
ncbi:MAG TPA: TonB-dependent receptor [Myxococcaceae bacterium]|nr:TonB-dependent receptor [Myxococcaceae bacterium]